VAKGVATRALGQPDTSAGIFDRSLQQ